MGDQAEWPWWAQKYQGLSPLGLKLHIHSLILQIDHGKSKLFLFGRRRFTNA